MKLFYNYPYDGDITEERISFIPVPYYEKFINELNSFFDGDEDVVIILAHATNSDPSIKLLCKSYHLLIVESLLSNELNELGQAVTNENIASILKHENVSELLSNWLSDVNAEEIYLSDYMAKLAVPGQTIQIERYDSEYGNYNYEVIS
jgi:hypothetical protein